MLKELDTPEWEKAFRSQFARDIPITREEVVAVPFLALPSHETYPWCRQYCGDGYLGIFELREGRFAALKAKCDGTSGEGECWVADDFPTLVLQLYPADRFKLGLHTEFDEKLIERAISIAATN